MRSHVINQVEEQDQLEMTIELSGVLGVDLTTVAGRESTRAALLKAAETQIDSWMASITVKEHKA